MNPLGSVEHALETTGVLAILKDLDQLYQVQKCCDGMKQAISTLCLFLMVFHPHWFLYLMKFHRK